MHKIWCLGSDGVNCEFRPKAQIYVGAETVGQFVTQYFAENGRRIPIIGQISINGSVKILGIPDDDWVCGLPFIENVLDLTVPHGWGDNDTSNQNWPIIPGGAYSNVAVVWSDSVPAQPAYMPRSPENTSAAESRVRDDSLRCRPCKCMRSPSTGLNPISNPRFNRRGDDRGGVRLLNNFFANIHC